MTSIRSTVRIEAPPHEVWDALADISTHAEWMADAEAIRFTSAQRAGVGTTFDCDTRIGPVKVVDRMEVTEWEEARTMGVRHEGLITGSGAFTLSPTGTSATQFTWDEELSFPWWLAGPIGARVASPVLRRIWQGNLRRLKRRVERGR